MVWAFGSASIPAFAQVLDYGGEQFARDVRNHRQTGFATYYASRFEGRRTASGTVFRHDALIAAHPSLPFGTLARVTNLLRGNSVIVRIADRGPAAAPRSKGVIIDLSHQAAKQLNILRHGRARVAVQALAPAGTLTAAREGGSDGADYGWNLTADVLPLRLDLELAAGPEQERLAIVVGCAAAACE